MCKNTANGVFRDDWSFVKMFLRAEWLFLLCMCVWMICKQRNCLCIGQYLNVCLSVTKTERQTMCNEYVWALIWRFVIRVFHDVPAGPAEAAERLWCPWPLSTGLVASAGANKGKRREEDTMQFKAEHGGREGASSSEQVQKQWQGTTTVRVKTTKISTKYVFIIVYFFYLKLIYNFQK